ncbi:MAG: MnmA/TRMU family protein, partial [Candidatus Sumerlaeota bacterium]
LLEWAREQGSDAVATGHYARVEPFPPTGLPTLRRAVYVKKDQTYFLSHLGVDALSGFITPVGHLQKEDVRRVAREAGLPVAERSESQEICFIADDNYRRFLQENSEDMGDSEDMAGEIVNMEGKALGRHAGIHHYTIGQRRGLGIGGSPEPIYVVELRPETKQVVVGPNEALFSKGLLADKMHYGGLGEIREPTPVRVKIRYRSEAVNATATPEDKGSLRIVFKTPQRAVTPGQTAAVYDCEGEWVIGGGEIFKSL